MSEKNLRHDQNSEPDIQQHGNEIAALLLEMFSSAAEREGIPPSREHLLEGISVMLSAAWAFAKLADSNEDGGRVERYANVLDGHLKQIKSNE